MKSVLNDEIREMLKDREKIMKYEDIAKRQSGLVFINKIIVDAYSKLLDADLFPQEGVKK